MPTESGPGWSGRENLYTIETSRLPLGVECEFCGKRSLVAIERLRTPSRTDMTPIKSLPLRCGCGSRHWIATIFVNQDQAEAFPRPGQR